MPFDFSTRRYISPTEGGGSDPKLTTVTIPPSVVSQVVLPPEGYDGYSQVTVPGVDYTIDPNITAINIVNGVNILGIIGTAEASAPKEVARYVIDENGAATVSDTNLTGAFNDVVNVGASALKDAFSYTNVYGDISFPNCVSVSTYGLANAFKNTNITFFNAPIISYYGVNSFNGTFYGCKNLTGVNFSNIDSSHDGIFHNAFAYSGLESIELPIFNGFGIDMCHNAFRGCSNLSQAYFNHLTNVRSSGYFQNAFYDCKNLTHVYFSSVTDIVGSGSFRNAFNGCSNLTYVDFSNLYTISTSSSGTNMFESAFNGCNNLALGDIFGAVNSISSSGFSQSSSFICAFANMSEQNMYFNNLTWLGGNGTCNRMFYRCNSINFYFPSFYYLSNSTNAFGSHMLQYATDCTLHFPKSAETTMSTWSHVISGFSGVNTTVLWDLPSVSNNWNVLNYHNITSSGTIGGNTFAVGASSESADAWMAMTTDMGTGWHSAAQEAPHYFDFYFPEGAQCYEIYMETSNSVDRTTNAPEFINTCVSDDGNTWKQVNASFISDYNTANYTRYRVRINNPRFHKYYRVFFNSYQNNPSYLTTINYTYFMSGLCRYNEE